MGKDEKQKPPTPPAPATFHKHDSDLIVVEVIHDRGVKDDGKVYRKGQTLTITRARALQQNRGGADKTFRILTTVRHVNDPNAESKFEDPPPGDDGPIEIS